jgi:hypothetical protein
MLLSGMLVNAEVIAIMLLSRSQPVDLPSVLSLLHRTAPRAARSAMLGD